MHRVPLGSAIFFLFILFFCAIEYNTEGLWTAFGINLVLVIIGVVRAYLRYKENIEEQYERRNIYSNNVFQNSTTNRSHLDSNNEKVYNSIEKLKNGLENDDPEALFIYAALKIKEAKTEEEKKNALNLIAYAAYKGSDKAQKVLDDLKAM